MAKFGKPRKHAHVVQARSPGFPRRRRGVRHPSRTQGAMPSGRQAVSKRRQAGSDTGNSEAPRGYGLPLVSAHPPPHTEGVIMRRIGRTSAVLVAAMACLSFSAVAVSAASAATVHPSSHALKASSSVAPEAAAQASGAGVAPGGLRVGAVPDALGAVLCGGDICLQSQCAHCAQQNIRVWAHTYGFRGHFEIQFGCSIAGCNTLNTNNAYWHAGGTGYTFTNIPSAVISSNVYGWKGGPPWTQIGHIGFYL